MTATPAMREFVRQRSRAQREAVLNEFLDAFGLDDDEGIALFEPIWREVGVAPAGARPGQTRGPAAQFGGRGGQGDQAPRIDDALLTAPYRFVALNDIVVYPEKAIEEAWSAGHLHDIPLPNGISGVLHATLTFDGPMLIGETESGTESPLRLDGRHVIPGATLRGLTRSTLEIAAFGRLYQTNLHRRFGIRDFNHHLFRDEARREVRAGWLRPTDPAVSDPDGGHHVIEPCEWWQVRIRDLVLGGGDPGEQHRAWLTKGLADRYERFGMKTGDRFDFGRPNRFSAVSSSTGARPLVKPNSQGEIHGIYVFSNASPSMRNVTAAVLDAQDLRPAQGDHKKTEAVFADLPSGEPIPVPAAVWRTFTANNSKPSRNKPKPAGNWRELEPTLTEGGRIPVFWVADGEGSVADFGLVRVFKRAHEHTVEDVLKRTARGAHLIDPDNVRPDFIDALFGFVHEPDERRSSEAAMHRRRHLKGRVAFGFAWLSASTPGREGNVIRSAMSAPQPSYAPFYLESRTNKDWSCPDARLTGRKRYPARGADAGSVRTWLERHRGNGNDATLSRLRFLEPAGAPLCFEAEIRVHNITRAELGGLIWALTFGGDPGKRHLIGRAKTAGAGQARIEIARMTLENADGTPPPKGEDLVEAFQRFMAGHVSGWPAVAPVRDLLKSADPAYGAGLSQRLDYLALNRHGELRKKVYDRDTPPAINRRRPRLMSFD